MSIAETLRRELGAAVVTDPVEMEPYGRDASGPEHYPPDVVVRPTLPEEVRVVLRRCSEARVPVTPRGAGTGKSGGALPVAGGVVLSLERMQRIFEVDETNRIAIVEPGVITAALQRTAEAQGLFYPPDPASLETCTLGGNVAENAGGPRAYRYGVTRDYILGLEVALMTGERLNLGRRTLKGVSGYDLTALVTGSEGTLAVIDRIVLRLLPKPPTTLTGVAAFPSAADAAAAVLGMARAGIIPTAIELLDACALRHVAHLQPWALPSTTTAALILEVDGHDDAVAAALARCTEACASAGALEVRSAADEAARATVWAWRRGVSEAQTEAHRHKVSEDVTVPVAEIPGMLDDLQRIGDRHDLLIGAYGHAGDGNLHVNLLSDDPDAAQARRAIEAATIDVVHACLERGGTLSGEHGIGTRKRAFMVLEHAPPDLEMMRAIKRAWDPLGLLNPGKLIPDPF